MRQHNNKNITKALMDQSIFAGIGNYIKAESLWLSKINPLKDVKQISDCELHLLCSSIKSIMTNSFNSEKVS